MPVAPTARSFIGPPSLLKSRSSKVKPARGMRAESPFIQLMPILEGLEDGVVLAEPTGRMKYANPAACRMLKESLEKLGARRTPLPCWPSSTGPTVSLACARCPVALQRSHFSCALFGAESTVRVTIQALRAKGGAVLCLMATLVSGRERPTSPRHAGRLPPAEIRAANPTLTGREAEVAAALIVHKRVKAMAGELGISPHTVRNHLKALFRKLAVTSQAELVDHLRGRRE